MIDRSEIRRGGFTLLETLIVMVVMALLLSLALPSYHDYVKRAQRAEAIHMLLSAAACQERIRVAHGHYDTNTCRSAPSEHYALRIEPAAEPAALEFVLYAEPRRGGGGDCGYLSLDQAGIRGIGGDPALLSDCWGGR